MRESTLTRKAIAKSRSCYARLAQFMLSDGLVVGNDTNDTFRAPHRLRHVQPRRSAAPIFPCQCASFFQ